MKTHVQNVILKGYATAPPPDNRYGAPPVANSGYADPYGYKAPAAGNY